jgi:hypothetical protein
VGRKSSPRTAQRARTTAFAGDQLAHLDRIDEAREVFKQVLELTPGLSVANIQRAIHFGRPDDLDRYLNGLRLAGLPE